MSQWRYYAGAGLFAAVISLIAGILGGNPFGVILLRMLFSALVLAGVALGAGILVRKFLPELSRETAAAPAGTPEPAVDIVLPEENPHQETLGVFAEGAEQETEETEEPEEVEPLEELAEEAAGPPGEPGELGEESAEPLSARPAAEVEEEAEEAVPLEEEEFSADGSEEIDALPDMEQFDSTNYVGPDISGLKNGGDDFTQAQVDGIMSREDPAQLAKAVRTFLKKDQEG